MCRYTYRVEVTTCIWQWVLYRYRAVCTWYVPRYLNGRVILINAIQKRNVKTESQHYQDLNEISFNTPIYSVFGCRTTLWRAKLWFPKKKNGLNLECNAFANALDRLRWKFLIIRWTIWWIHSYTLPSSERISDHLEELVIFSLLLSLLRRSFISDWFSLFFFFFHKLKNMHTALEVCQTYNNNVYTQ